jgi:hypothetical protein
MTISMILVVAWCFGAMTFIPAAASAAEGQINFSGAIVEPTCAIPTAQIATRPGTQRVACIGSGNIAAASRGYALTSVRLTSSVSDRVLKYFDTYVKASQPGTADPVLLTQVYE